MAFMCEPDIIAANENVMPDINNDLILAKNFLKKQSAATGDTLYDHLVDMVHRLLTEQPPNVVDYFEQFSWDVKKDKLRPNFDLLKDIYKSPPQLKVVRKMDEMFKTVQKSHKTVTAEDEEEPVLDLEQEADQPSVADLIEHNHNFRQCGFGLPEHECYAVYIALNLLAIKEPVARVRFFGKIYGTKKNYYIAETELNEEEMEKQIKEFEDRENPEEESEEGAHEVPDEKDMIEEGGEESTRPRDARPKLPPVPQPTHVPPPPIPPERPGQGVNKKVYYACNSPGDAWVRLPDVTPDQIRVARQTVRCMTGDLDAEVITFPAFSGTERNFLRAQLARIQAATAVSPQGFYTFGSGEEEEDIDFGEDMGDMDFNVNSYYEGHTLQDLTDPELASWVHHGRHILRQGRTIWWNTNANAEESGEEEEEAAAAEEPERGPALFAALAEDGAVCGAAAWAARASSALVPARALAALRSAVWPGAVAYATTGKMSECMYVGWGVKYAPPNYTPPPLGAPRDEYPPGPEVMEMADPTVDEEEAYRIAHLPPQPPMGEGEEEYMEEEEEED